MLGLKVYEIKSKKELSFTSRLRRFDRSIHDFIGHVKHEISYLTWNNMVLLFKYITKHIHDYFVSTKKRLDSRQPRFLVATTPTSLAHKNKRNPSSFLRAIGNDKKK